MAHGRSRTYGLRRISHHVQQRAQAGGMALNETNRWGNSAHEGRPRQGPVADLHDLVGTGEEQRMLAGNTSGAHAVYSHLAVPAPRFGAEPPMNDPSRGLLPQE